MCMHFVASDEREERDWRRDDRRGDDRRGDDRRGGDRCAGLPYLACRMAVLAVSTYRCIFATLAQRHVCCHVLQGRVAT